jgi:TolB protein
MKVLPLLILCIVLLNATSSAESLPVSSTTRVTGKIAFEHNVAKEGESIEIYVMNADGGGIRNLTRNPANDFGPAWSPDARKIAFQSYRCGPKAQSCDTRIFVMRANGDGQHRITRTHGDGGAAWSPDGQEIAFVRNERTSAGQLVGAIWIMNADGSRQRRLTRGDSPAWSPGQKIAFAGYRCGSKARSCNTRSALFVMNADGSGQGRLTRNQGNCCPAWSPDSRKIAFVRNIVSGGVDHDEIFVMNADGSNQRSLTRGNSPTWSPNGRQIAFLGTRFGIWRMSSDGSGKRRILPRPGLPEFSFGENWGPTWSPR